MCGKWTFLVLIDCVFSLLKNDNPVTIAGLQAEVWTWDFSNTKRNFHFDCDVRRYTYRIQPIRREEKSVERVCIHPEIGRAHLLMEIKVRFGLKLILSANVRSVRHANEIPVSATHCRPCKQVPTWRIVLLLFVFDILPQLKSEATSKKS